MNSSSSAASQLLVNRIPRENFLCRINTSRVSHVTGEATQTNSNTFLIDIRPGLPVVNSYMTAMSVLHIKKIIPSKSSM